MLSNHACHGRMKVSTTIGGTPFRKIEVASPPARTPRSSSNLVCSKRQRFIGQRQDRDTPGRAGEHPTQERSAVQPHDPKAGGPLREDRHPRVGVGAYPPERFDQPDHRQAVHECQPIGKGREPKRVKTASTARRGRF